MFEPFAFLFTFKCHITDTISNGKGKNKFSFAIKSNYFELLLFISRSFNFMYNYKTMNEIDFYIIMYLWLIYYLL